MREANGCRGSILNGWNDRLPSATYSRTARIARWTCLSKPVLTSGCEPSGFKLTAHARLSRPARCHGSARVAADPSDASVGVSASTGYCDFT